MMVKSRDKECSPLLGPPMTKKKYWPLLVSKHCFEKGRFFVKSKAAILVLVWNFCISLLLTSWLDPIYYTTIVTSDFKYLLGLIVPIFCCFSATVYLFYPLAGYMADVKYGRYRVITCSLCFIPWILISLGIFLAVFWLWWVPREGFLVLTKAMFWAMIAVGLLVSVAVLTCHTAFSANVIQFGMDQLYESPTEDSILFIYWFVFTSYLGFALFKLSWYKTPLGLTGIGVLLTLGMVILLCSHCLARCKRRQWFLIHAGSKNPYKMVYKVIQFAMHHKNPIRRSAFTYCEDELPSRMDLAKDKYGGPFSTEEVENVKVFLGIFCLLLTLGPVFTSDIARTSLMYEFSIHLEGEFPENNTDGVTVKGNYFASIFNLGILTEVLTVIFIAMYVCLMRPFFLNSKPKLLKGLGLGMFLLVLSLISLLLIDIVLNSIPGQPHHRCFLSSNFNISSSGSNATQSLSHTTVSRWYLILPHTFNALGYMSFYPSAYAFICAQSPHAMKGLLIGTFFAIKGIFQLLGALISLSFLKWKEHFVMSCGSMYFVVNIVFSLIGLMTYVCAARNYRYRQRDEPDNTYRYAEEYYDKSDFEAAEE